MAGGRSLTQKAGSFVPVLRRNFVSGCAESSAGPLATLWQNRPPSLSVVVQSSAAGCNALACASGRFKPDRHGRRRSRPATRLVPALCLAAALPAALLFPLPVAAAHAAHAKHAPPAAPAAVQAVPAADRVLLSAGGVTLELSAPRADVLRVRLGHPGLPEDAS